MKTLSVVFIAGLLFVFSPVADWVAVNTPDWVGALILVVGLPWGAYAFFRMLFRFAKAAK